MPYILDDYKFDGRMGGWKGRRMCNLLVLGGFSWFLGGVPEMHFNREDGGSTYISETSATLLTSTHGSDTRKTNPTATKNSENLKSIEVTHW
jgi:hypothetical protein